MPEYMKKALIAALLVISTAFVPCLSNIADFPDRTSELARAAASPLFWQFWDELLSRELAQWTRTVSDDSRKSDWLPEFRDDSTCLFFHVFLKHACEVCLSVVGENDRFLVSIPKWVIRRTVEWELILVSEHSARYGFYQEESRILGEINATKDFQNDCISKFRAGCRARLGVASKSTGRQGTVSEHVPA